MPSQKQTAVAEVDPDFRDGLHLPTMRAMLELLLVDSQDRGFYYNESNDYGCVHLNWWSGKGDPFKRYAGEAKLSNYMNRDGSMEVRPNGMYTLNEKAIGALVKQITAQKNRQAKELTKEKVAAGKTRTAKAAR